MSRLPVALLAVSIPLSALAWAPPDKPEDAEGVKDHPTIPRFPGAAIVDGESRDFEEYELPVKLGPEGEYVTRHVEGRYTKVKYDNPDKASATEIVRNYQAALDKAGFKTLFEQKSTDERRFTSELSTKGKVWVDIYVYKSNDTFLSELVVVEGKAMEQKLELDAGGMLDELNKSGKVAIYGIVFDTGKATITADSAKILGEIVKLLSTNPTLKLRVEGHTDNVGKSAANLDLSKKRAISVRDWLMKADASVGARLTTDGFGDSKPVGDNKTEAGRAQNRRVELVKL